MKFKFLGLIWDLKTPLQLVWMMLGGLVIGGTFAIPDMNLIVFLIYCIGSFIYTATAKSVSDWFDKLPD